MKTYGFIGTGNMGGALASALCRTVDPSLIYLSDKSAEKATALAVSLGCRAVDTATLASSCDCVILGVKPQVLPAVLAEIRPIFLARTDKPLLVSMAAGVSLATISDHLDLPLPLLRIMPNTSVSVGEGMILVAANPLVSETQKADFLAAFSAAGKRDIIPESLIDAACALSGCGPAFVYLFLEALADGGVACGLSRDKAMLYAAQTVLGAAQTVLTTGQHPGQLKDAVCSPAGATIAGVCALEEGAFRSAATKAVLAAFARTKELGN